jgi:hypothetical protein
MDMYGLKRLRFEAARTRWRVPLIWIRHRGMDSRDVFLASYPRSGQYWLRFLLIESLTGKSGEFDNVDMLVPRVGAHGQVPATLPSGGRVIQTHEGYRKEYKKAIFLVRDLRDVVISEYDHARATVRFYADYTFDRYLLGSLRGEVQGIVPWNDHVHSWLDSPLGKRGNLLVIKFEDMRNSPEKILSQILQFLEVDADPEIVRAAVANNTVERMRIKEDRRQTKNRSGREQDRHVRSGSVGGWREKLTDAQVELIQRYAGEALKRLGYPLESERTSDRHKDSLCRV